MSGSDGKEIGTVIGLFMSFGDILLKKDAMMVRLKTLEINSLTSVCIKEFKNKTHHCDSSVIYKCSSLYVSQVFEVLLQRQ